MQDDVTDNRPRSTSRRAIAPKPTLKTIADVTGLAVTTVSRALNDAPEIAKATRKRVRDVADEIGYSPDRAAQRLRTGRTKVISLVLDPHEEILGFGTSLISGITEALRGTPYHLVVTPHFLDVPAIDPIRQILRNRHADAIIFARTEPFDERVRLLIENDFPFVCHGRTELTVPHPFVDYDNYAFSYAAAGRLIARGRRRLALLGPPRRFTFHTHMRHGFMTAVRESGIAFDVPEDITIDRPPDLVYDWCRAAISAPERPEGFVCGGEVSALAVLAALGDAGLEVGRDADVIGKQTSDVFSQVRPRIDTIYEDLHGSGRALGEIILRRLDGAPPADLQVLQAPEMMFKD